MHSPLPRPAASWRPRAVVFDCDGVLMDTERAWAHVQDRVAQDYGVAFDDASRVELMGRSARDVAEWITHRAHAAADPSAGAVTVARVLEHLLRVEERIVSRTADPLPGAVETVTACAAHVPVAVASNSTAAILDRKMRVTGLDTVVHTWVSSDDVAEGKPSPLIYLEAVRRLDRAPHECLAVEDSPTGTTAAVRAGLGVLAVPLGHDLPVSAHWYADSLADPRVSELLADWGLAPARR